MAHIRQAGVGRQEFIPTVSDGVIGAGIAMRAGHVGGRHHGQGCRSSIGPLPNSASQRPDRPAAAELESARPSPWPISWKGRDQPAFALLPGEGFSVRWRPTPPVGEPPPIGTPRACPTCAMSRAGGPPEVGHHGELELRSPPCARATRSTGRSGYLAHQTWKPPRRSWLAATNGVVGPGRNAIGFSGSSPSQLAREVARSRPHEPSPVKFTNVARASGRAIPHD